jgi:hypothetical protein
LSTSRIQAAKEGGASTTTGNFISLLTYCHDRKKFIIYEEPTLAYCLVYLIVALAFLIRPLGELSPQCNNC